jgi:hypothetical protein
MLQLTSRDEAMLDWMNVVRLADVEAIRWALAAYQDDHEGAPVSIRRANHWIARMAELGYLGRMRPVYRDRQIVWPTYQSSGRAAPRLFRQTMRHELAVAVASGRCLAAGYKWSRDRRSSAQEHQADGVASRGTSVELIEVELTVKKLTRYQGILGGLAARVAAGEASRVVYLGTALVAPVISRQADLFIFRTERPSVQILSVFSEDGVWSGDATPWSPRPVADRCPACN